MRLKTLVLCSSSAAILAFAASPALAQEDPTPPDAAAETQEAPADEEPAGPETAAAGEETEIVVTGIRRSLQSAQNIRRNSENIIDSVVAEDIGKLPDLNTAQTAARIPGVQVYRQGGEAQNVLVRGLPNFTTTYNGREIFTAETRIVALQDFPSSNIAALEVFKTSSADLVEPGLAGLVNVRSRQPFDFREGQIAGSVWALHTRQGGKTTGNFNFLGTKRWDVGDGDVGVLLNVSRTDMRYLDAEISNTDFLQTFSPAGPGRLIGNPALGTAARFPDIMRLFYRSGRRIRPSVNAAVQFRPKPGFEVYFEGLWQGFRNKVDDRLLAAELHGGPDSLQYSNLQFREGTNLLTSGTVIARPGSLFSFQGGTFNKTDTFQYAGGIRATLADRLKMTLDIARTESTFRGSTESVDRRWTDAPTINFDNSRPQFEITNIDMTDTSEQFFDGLYEENQKSTGEDWQLRADFDYELGGPFLKSFEFGVRYTTRDAERRFGSRFARTAALLNASNLPVQSEVFDGVNFGGTTEWAAPSYRAIRDGVVSLRRLVGFSDAPVVAGLLYTADETNLAGYGQLNLGNDDIDGSIGLRASRVKTRVAGAFPTGIPEIDEGSRKTVLLPNASFRARVNETLQLRAAASKTRTLANFADLNPSLQVAPATTQPGGIGTGSNPRTGTGGNPFLRPFTSWNFDAAAEFYFARTGFVSITGFHRRVKGFIQQATFDIDTGPDNIGVLRITGPVNGGKGRITGVELQGQAFADFDWVPDWARGFGIQANLTYLDAKVGGEPITDQLNGVSKWNYNLVGIYERHGLAARLTYNGRSRFRATQQNRCCGEFQDVYTEWAHPADRLDLSLNYDIDKRFTIFGDWTNITEKTFRQDFTSGRNGAPVAEFIRYRRYDESTLSLGLRFRFGG